jgi:hypothetical protein
MLYSEVARRPKEGVLSNFGAEGVKGLLNYMDAKFPKHRGKDYAFVSTPGPDVMRMRVALTEADASKVVVDTLSSIMPIVVALRFLCRVAIGEPVLSWSIAVGMEGCWPW